MHMSNNPAEQPTNQQAGESQPSTPPRRYWWLRVLVRLMFMVAFLLLLLRVLVGIPYVQNRLVKATTAYLSHKLDTRVSIDYFYFRPLDRISLSGFIVEDQQRDTLLFAERLEADISLFSLFSRQLVVQQLTLQGAEMQVVAPKAGATSNVQFIFDGLFPPQPPQPPQPPKSSPWRLTVKSVRLTDVAARIDNHYNGVLMRYGLQKGQVDIASLRSGLLDIQKIKLRGLQAYYGLDSVMVPYIPTLYDSLYGEWPQPVDTFEREPLRIRVGVVELAQSQFHYQSMRLPSPDQAAIEGLDYRNMRFDTIGLKVRDVAFDGTALSAEVAYLNFWEHSGFKLIDLSGALHIDTARAMLADMTLVTPYSRLSDTLAFEYRTAGDWGNFVDRVGLDVRLAESELGIRDLLHVVPALRSNSFFAQNIDEQLSISGHVYDRVNRLKGRDINLRLNGTRLIGSFRSRALTRTDEASLNLRLERLTTDMDNVQLFFKGTRIPEELMRLGQLDFSGSLDGFLLNFVTRGRLKTSLGTADSNMKFNFQRGRQYQSYSGDFGLQAFDLGKLLDNPDLGAISLDVDITGKGYALNTIDTRLEGDLQAFSYKGYTYSDIHIDGDFAPNSFEGELNIDDEHVQLDFDGTINFNDSLPVFDLRTDIARLHLKPLQLTQEDYRIESAVTLAFSGNNAQNIEGYAALRRMALQHHFVVEGRDTVASYTFDSLRIDSKMANRQIRRYQVASDLLTGELSSNYEVANLKQVLLNYAMYYFPKFGRALALPKRLGAPDSTVYTAGTIVDSLRSFFEVELAVSDSKNWMQLLDRRLGSVRGLYFHTAFSHALAYAEVDSLLQVDTSTRLHFELNAPSYRFGNIQFGELSLDISGVDDSLGLVGDLLDTHIGDSLTIPAVGLQNRLQAEEFNFSVNGDAIGDIARKLKFQGRIQAIDDIFRIEIDTSDFVLYNRSWSISQGNSVTIADRQIKPENVRLYNAEFDETINLLDNGTRGISLDLKNISLDWIKEFVDLGGYELAGRMNGRAQITDLFSVSGFSAKAQIDSAQFSGRLLGSAQLNVGFSDLKHPIAYEVTIDGERESHLQLRGNYRLPRSIGNPSSQGHFAFKANVASFPLQVIELFVGDYIAETRGRFDGDLIMDGLIDKPNINGTIRVVDVGTRVKYLQTYYRIASAQIGITNNAFIIRGREVQRLDGEIEEGCVVRDSRNNSAFVQGAIMHNHLKNFYLQITMSSDKFTLLDTDKDTPELFYGTAIGSATMQVTGELESPNINITATSLAGTEIVIPISYGSSSSAVNFIEFVHQEGDSLVKDEPIRYTTPKGLSVEMNINVTPAAEIRLVFDEQTGDQIRGRGAGNLQLEVTRTGAFNMYGTYQIERGEYLFTYQNLINKPFEVEKGGTITWTGDPFDADMNLTAYYSNLSVAPYNFIAEYGLTESETQAAKSVTRVDLKMLLAGELFSPEIKFDLDFPNLKNELKSYVESKLKVVREDKNELNRQVFGLIVLGGFLPSNASFDEGGLVVGTGLNTLTELLSNQFSLYFSDFLSQMVGDKGVISSIDVDLNYRLADFNSIDLGNLNTFNNNNEVQLGVRNGLFDDRVIISGNVNFDDVNGGGLNTGEFEVEWKMTDNGRWRMRVFSRTEENFATTGQAGNGTNIFRSGASISYTREFDSFKELWRDVQRKK